MSTTDKLDDIGIAMDNLRCILEIGTSMLMDISGAGEHQAEINRVLSLLMVSRDVAAKAHLDLAAYPPKAAA